MGETRPRLEGPKNFGKGGGGVGEKITLINGVLLKKVRHKVVKGGGKGENWRGACLKVGERWKK